MRHAAPVYAAALAVVAFYLGWVIVVALGAESLLVAGPRLAQDPWGWVTIVDLYLGFLVFGGYLAARERNPWRTLPWLVALMALGNIVSAVYLAWALHRGGYRLAALVEPAHPDAGRR